MIISKLIKIEYTNDNTIIEQELSKLGIEPLRWAIVGADENELTISISYEY